MTVAITISNQVAGWRKTIRATLLEAGLNAHTTVPERPAPPIAFISPSDPYLAREEGRPFTTEVLRLEVVVVASKGVNDVKADELDDMILTAVDALDTLDLVVRRVDRPGQISLANQPYLATTINVEIEIDRSV